MEVFTAQKMLNAEGFVFCLVSKSQLRHTVRHGVGGKEWKGLFRIRSHGESTPAHREQSGNL